MKKFKQKRNVHKKFQFSFLEKHIIVAFLLNMKSIYLPYYNVFITPYLIGVRRKHSFFNISYLISQVRNMLYQIYLHSFFKGLIVIFSSDQTSDWAIGHRLFYYFPNWPNGFLTNFRHQVRRMYLQHRYKRSVKSHDYSCSALFVTKKPQLPTIAISFGIHNHWFYNEAHHLRLVQFGPDMQSNVLPFNNSIIPRTVMLRLIREAILAAKLDDRYFFLHKRLKTKKVSVKKIFDMQKN